MNVKGNDRIVFVIPALLSGGMERVMVELMNYFSRTKDDEIHLVLYGIRNEIFYILEDSIIIHRPKQSIKSKFKVITALKSLLFLRKTVKKISPISVLSFGEILNGFVLISLFGLRVNLFVSDRCNPENSFGFIHDYIRKLFYPAAKGIIAQTDFAKKIYLKQFKHNNIKVIGNPVKEIKPDFINKENIILSVGRIIPSKNHDKLIEMFIQIGEPNWKLVIVGGDYGHQSFSNKLKDIIEESNATNIIIAGRQLDVKRYYDQCSIFAFPSSSEGFPNVIAEAMSAGLPVVAFDKVLAPSGLIKNGIDGVLVTNNDFTAFALELKKLMSDEKRRAILGLNASKSIQAFSIPKIGEQYYSFIKGEINF